MKKIILVFAFLCSVSMLSQVQLSHKATVSVLTCGAGENLYTAFGHNAFRVYDPVTKIDNVYNYGTFDTSKPNFYYHFVKGKMTYVLSVTTFNSFLREYQYFGRWVKMQQLNLSSSDVQKMYAFLENNAKPQNRAYQYDFYYQNCATKIGEVLKKVLKNKVSFTNHHITTIKTHRQLLADYTAKKFSWAGFGMDLVLGTSNDKQATKNEYQFLPDYVYQAVENATIINNKKREPLVLKSYDILPQKVVLKNNFFTPFMALLLVSLLVLYITYKNYKNYKNQKISKWLDIVLHLFTGSVGVVVLLLWLGTNHTTTYSNWNILWAFAPNVTIAFVLLFKNKRSKWLQYYYKMLLIGIVCSFLIWIFGIQQFHIALLPFLVALFVRYVLLLKRL